MFCDGHVHSLLGTIHPTSSSPRALGPIPDDAMIAQTAGKSGRAYRDT